MEKSEFNLKPEAEISQQTITLLGSGRFQTQVWLKAPDVNFCCERGQIFPRWARIICTRSWRPGVELPCPRLYVHWGGFGRGDGHCGGARLKHRPPQRSPQVLPVALVSGAEGGVRGGQTGPLEELWGQLCRNPATRSLPKTLSKIFKLNIYTANSVFLPVWTGGGLQMGPGDVGRQNAEKWERSRLGARGQRSGESRWRPGINVCPLSLTSRAF